MSSRDRPRTPPGRSSSSYRMNKAANMRMQENIRRASAVRPRQKHQRMSQVRVSRVSVASSRNSMRSTGGSRRSLASVATQKSDRRQSRKETSAQRDNSSPRQRQRKQSKRTRSGSTIEENPGAQYSGRTPEVTPIENESNEQFMASNYTYSIVSSEDTAQPKIIPASDILTKHQENTADVSVEGGWRIVEYIRSVKNSIFKEAENIDVGKQNSESVSVRVQGSNSSQEPVKKIELTQKIFEPSSSSVFLQSPEREDNENMRGEKNASGVQASSKPPKKLAKANEKKSLPQRLKRSRSNIDTGTKKMEKLNLRRDPKNTKDVRQSTASTSSTVSPRKSVSSVGTSASEHSRSSKDSANRLPKSVLKASKSLVSLASSSSQKSIKGIMSPERKGRKVSILATMGSLEDLATKIAQLEREKALEGIRRLEEVAKDKRRQLAATRMKMRASLEEEIKINKQLEKILAKIRIVRQAGEDASLIYDKQTQVFSTRRSLNDMKKPDKYNK